MNETQKLILRMVTAIETQEKHTEKLFNIVEALAQRVDNLARDTFHCDCAGFGHEEQCLAIQEERGLR